MDSACCRILPFQPGTITPTHLSQFYCPLPVRWVSIIVPFQPGTIILTKASQCYFPAKYIVKRWDKIWETCLSLFLFENLLVIPSNPRYPHTILQNGWCPDWSVNHWAEHGYGYGAQSLIRGVILLSCSVIFSYHLHWRLRAFIFEQPHCVFA